MTKMKGIRYKMFLEKQTKQSVYYDSTLEWILRSLWRVLE